MRKDQGKENKDLLKENFELRQRIAELEASVAGRPDGEPPWVTSDWLEIAEQAANIGFYNWNMVTGQLIWSEGFCNLFGLPPGAKPSFETWLSVLHPDDRERVMASINESVAEKAPLVNEYRITLSDGRVRWISAVGNTFYDDTGKPLRSCGVCVDITERKLAEEALRRNEKYLRFALDTIGAGAWDMDLADHSAFRSLEHDRIFGYDRLLPEWTYEMFLGHVLPEDRELVDDKFRQAIEQRSDWNFECRIRRRDGAIRWICAAGRHMQDVKGSPSRMAGIVQEITERKTVEECIGHLASFPELNPNPVLEVDLSGEILFCNPGARKILENMGMDKGNCRPFCPGDLDAILKNCDKKSEDTLNLEVTIKDRVFGETVQLIPKFGVCRIYAHDITELKHTQEALLKAHDELEMRVQERTAQLGASQEMEQEQRREIETYYQTAPIGLCVLDTGLRYLRINERLAAWNGKTAADHIGRTLREMVPWIADEAERVARQVMETGRPVTDMEMAPGAGRPGNGRIWMAGWYPMKNSGGAVAGVSVVVEDITEQRKLEEQLHQSRKMEAMGVLAGGIAHDFNNMLAAILGFTEMAIEDVRDRPHVDRSLQNVSKAAMRARELVKQILTFSRKTSHKRHPLSLTSVVEETLQLLRASIPATTRITFAATAATDTVLAAPTEIQQVLMNLVTNASIAMRDKGGVIEVTLSDIDVEPGPSVLLEDPTPREYVRLLVRDTGIGMSPAVMRRMFEPFFTTREAGAGSGMGLAVVYGIVKDLGGTITVESEPGVGSTFSVLLPKADTEESTQDAQPAEIPGGAERILFVDDEELLVEWARTALERIGYEVTAVTDSRQALKIFSANPSSFDLVITDQAMPGMGGTQLAKELLAITGGIPIILCTGHSDIVSRESAAAIGFADFLMKPINKVELATSIRRALDTIK